MVPDDFVEIVLRVFEGVVERHVRGVDVDVYEVLVRDLSEEHHPTLNYATWSNCFIWRFTWFGSVRTKV